MSVTSSASDIFERLLNDPEQEFAVIRRHDSDEVDVLFGRVETTETLAEISLKGSGAGREGSAALEVLALVPFRQMRERGFEVHDDGTPLEYLVIESSARLNFDDLLERAVETPINLAEERYDQSDEEYADLVRGVVRDEIGQGEGANFVIRRDFRAMIPEWSRAKALSVFGNLLRNESGAYWTFYVQTKQRALIGASPERHVSSDAGVVRMNPISGTFRIPAETTTPEELRVQLDLFLRDRKEILELMMVVDEELKMMASICPTGGRVTGPYLKVMSRVVHTEYILEGDSVLDTRELLRRSMFAATVVGSPVENACRIIKKYETSGRGYYGSVLALFGRDENGHSTLDAPILIRTAHIDSDGEVTVSVGATLVRDSDPASEVAETRSKIAGLLAAFRPTVSGSNHNSEALKQIAVEVEPLLTSRNSAMAAFWSERFTGAPQHQPFAITANLITAEDEFAVMLAHVLSSLGVTVNVMDWRSASPNSIDDCDLLILGPGPGDPRRAEDPRIARLRTIAANRLSAKRPILGVCLGHQLLSAELGFDLAPKKQVVQGSQEVIQLFGRERTVGFYNTFTSRLPAPEAAGSVEIAAVGDEIVAMRGAGFAGMQFHPESIITLDGREIVEETLRFLFPAE